MLVIKLSIHVVVVPLTLSAWLYIIIYFIDSTSDIKLANTIVLQYPLLWAIHISLHSSLLILNIRYYWCTDWDTCISVLGLSWLLGIVRFYILCQWKHIQVHEFYGATCYIAYIKLCYFSLNISTLVLCLANILLVYW